MMIDRRDFLKTAGAAAALAALGDIPSALFASDIRMAKFPEKTDLVLLTSRPPQLETPLHYFKQMLIYTDVIHQCTCTPNQIQRYRARVSGPLLDRIDLHVEVPSVKYRDLSDDRPGESSEKVRGRVNKARDIQVKRLGEDGIYCNSQMKPRHLKRFCAVDDKTHSLLEHAVERLGLSARAYNRIIKVARTIADLDNREAIQAPDVSEAIQYRSLDRKLI